MIQYLFKTFFICMLVLICKAGNDYRDGCNPQLKYSTGIATQGDNCACEDTPPDEDFNCTQQFEFLKCDADFMKGYCECTCGTCTLISPIQEDDNLNEKKDDIEPVETCDERDEIEECAQRRKFCCDICQRELGRIDFECGLDECGSYWSSCGCAGRD